MPERAPREPKNLSKGETGPIKEGAMGAENQTERWWFLEEEKHLLEVTHIDNHGKKYVESDYEYKKGMYTARIHLILHPDSVKLEVIPYLLQIFHKKISDLPSRTILRVGLIDHENVAFLVFDHTDMNHHRDFQQYFFEKDGRPGGVRTNRISTHSWPLNRPQVVLQYMLPHFNELGSTLSGTAADSLRDAVARLMKPGEEFKNF